MNAGSSHAAPQMSACLCVRDLSAFSLLVEDMHAELGENWGELSMTEALDFLDHDDAKSLGLLILATDEDDRDGLVVVEQVISKARRIGLPTLLVAEDLTALEVYQLTQCGATPHMDYPLQEGDLAVALADIAPDMARPLVQKVDKGNVFAVQGISGGAGSSTLAINLARELAALGTGRVCLLDLDVQFGSIGLELGLPESDAALDLLFDDGVIDPEWLTNTMQDFGPNMSVLTAPSDVIPLDRVRAHGLVKLLAMAQTQYDYVVVDMPKAVSVWTQTVFDWADTVFCPVVPGKKSSALVDRFRNTCLGEGLDLAKVQFIANRIQTEGGTRTAEELNRLSMAAGQPVQIVLPDAGNGVDASSSFAPMSSVDPDNILGQQINRLAKTLSDARLKAA